MFTQMCLPRYLFWQLANNGDVEVVADAKVPIGFNVVQKKELMLDHLGNYAAPSLRVADAEVRHGASHES